MPGFLFDSHALLAFFQNERGAGTVLEFLKKTKNNGIEPLICVINLGEVLYLTKRRFGDAKKINIADINILTDLAASVGLDVKEANAMLAARPFRAAVDTDWTRAYESGVTAVPTFLLNGQTLVGAQPYNALASFMLQNNVKQHPSNHECKRQAEC